MEQLLWYKWCGGEGEGGRNARREGCLGRRSSPETWPLPRSQPPRPPCFIFSVTQQKVTRAVLPLQSSPAAARGGRGADGADPPGARGGGVLHVAQARAVADGRAVPHAQGCVGPTGPSPSRPLALLRACRPPPPPSLPGRVDTGGAGPSAGCRPPPGLPPIPLRACTPRCPPPRPAQRPQRARPGALHTSHAAAWKGRVRGGRAAPDGRRAAARSSRFCRLGFPLNALLCRTTFSSSQMSSLGSSAAMNPLTVTKSRCSGFLLSGRAVWRPRPRHGPLAHCPSPLAHRPSPRRRRSL